MQKKNKKEKGIEKESSIKDIRREDKKDNVSKMEDISEYELEFGFPEKEPNDRRRRCIDIP